MIIYSFVDVFSFSSKLFIQRCHYLAIVYFFFLYLYGNQQNKLTTAARDFIVVLDAGHGGKDPGSLQNGCKEKTIALQTVLKIGKLLEKTDGIKPLYTRKKDVFIPLNERTIIANEADADIFISVHCDAHPRTNVSGAGTFVLGLHENKRNFEIAKKENSVIFYEENYDQKYQGFDPNDPASTISLLLMQESYLDQSILAASMIQQSFVQNLKRIDRKVKQAGFLVLRNTYMPSVLVELGFLTNKKESTYLSSERGQNQMASAIAKAIVNYKKELENKTEKNGKVEFLAKAPSTVYRVQIAAGSKPITPVPSNFNELYPIERIKTDGLYRYYYEKTGDLLTAKKMLKRAKRRGFPQAFLVAFRNGKRLTAEEYRQLGVKN